MTISDILNVTGGRTNVIICGINKEDQYITLWKGQVDDIDYPYVPYGNYYIVHMTVINGEDNLVLYFIYPELSKKEQDILGEFAIGYPYPTEWIVKLYIKYRNFDKMREILLKSQEEVLKEISFITGDDNNEEAETKDNITIGRWSSAAQGHGIDIMIESGTENRIIYKGTMELGEFAKCITAQSCCKITTEIE